MSMIVFIECKKNHQPIKQQNLNECFNSSNHANYMVTSRNIKTSE